MGLRKKEKESFSKYQNQKSLAKKPDYYQAPGLDFDDSIELDVIERLKANIAMLQDLQSRNKFMNKELASIIGSKN